jgi:hypothetical protein
MTDKQKIKLLNLIETQVVAILISNNICDYIKKPSDALNKKTYNKFTNLRILEPYHKELFFFEITDEMIDNIRNLYPKGCGRKGDVSTIKQKLEKFLLEYPSYNYELIINVLKAYVQDMNYSGRLDLLFDLNNIFYKMENRSFTKSPIISLIEKYNETLKSNKSELVDVDDITEIDI